jgi:thiamine kinase-like enzyme
MGVTPREVLSTIPGWEGAVATELNGGLSNRTWRVDKNGRSAVLKIDERPRGEPYNTRRQEAQAQSRAFDAGLATRVLFVGETVYVSEYVEGLVWSADCLDNDSNIEQLAMALRKLHSLPLTGRVFDAAGAAREYARRIVDRDDLKVRDCLQKIEAAPLPPNLCFCHNDLVVENIINTPETRFLDWEYACDNDPFFDLATVVAHHGLTSSQRDVLLDAYFDGDGSHWREQLERQAVVYESLLYLWEQARRDRG